MYALKISVKNVLHVAFFISFSVVLVKCRGNITQEADRFCIPGQKFSYLYFKCGSGECFGAQAKCNGKVDCADASDETEKLCKDWYCTEFRCKYGACIQVDKQCNGVGDCADGSDEDPEICGNQTTNTTNNYNNEEMYKSCLLPPQPNGGKYTLSNMSAVLMSTRVKPYTLITISCSEGYQLYPPTHVVPCIDGNWAYQVPQCIRTCKPLISTTVDLSCTWNGIKKNCNEPMLEGTQVNMRCKRYHFTPHASNFLAKDLTCQDGSWSSPILDCIAECGRLDKKVQLFVINGQDVKIESHPWHVGVYMEEDNEIVHICGGSLLNPRVVISAAHCFSEVTNGEPFNAKEYRIAAGKNYRDYNDENDKKTVVKRKVSKIIIHPEYRGFTLSFSHDIALVILDEPIIPTELISSVCVDNDNDFVIDSEETGTVVGWGVTQVGGELGDSHLKRLTVPLIDKQTCSKTVPRTYRSFLTADKFCAGYTNGSSVCQGDSGGGLITKGRDGFYYIRGIVSNGPFKDSFCDNKQLTVYTRVSDYLEFIDQHKKN